jgi:hypothetical protein
MSRFLDMIDPPPQELSARTLFNNPEVVWMNVRRPRDSPKSRALPVDMRRSYH